jgi:hypothetical protein
MKHRFNDQRPCSNVIDKLLMMITLIVILCLWNNIYYVWNFKIIVIVTLFTIINIYLTRRNINEHHIYYEKNLT